MAAIETKPASCRFQRSCAHQRETTRKRICLTVQDTGLTGRTRPCRQRTPFAAWADKRDFRHGYDIWGSYYQIGEYGIRTKRNSAGRLLAGSKQHHTAVAGHDTRTLLVAWDDEREGNVDVMLSWYEAGGWSDDWPLPGAWSGAVSNPLGHAGQRWQSACGLG